MQYGLQVTRLEICIRRKQPQDVLYKEADMAVLSCVVVACSARLESLDLCLGSSSTSSADPYAQSLLVRPLCLGVRLYCVGLGLLKEALISHELHTY